MSDLIPDPGHPDQWLVPASYLDGRIVQAPTVLKGIHLSSECAGRTCLVHNPTDHHMRHWPLLWDSNQQLFLRLCRHGYAHPDPDGWGSKEHPDDGCCRR